MRRWFYPLALVVGIIIAVIFAQRTTREPVLQPSVEITDFPMEGGSVSPYGSYLATWSEGVFAMRDADTGELLWQQTNLALDRFSWVNWSPGGDRVAVQVDLSQEVRQPWVFDLQTGERLFELLVDGERVDVFPSYWSADGQRLIAFSWDDTYVYIFDGFTGELLTELEMNSSLSLWSPDSTRLVTVDTSATPPQLVVWSTDPASSPERVFTTPLPEGSYAYRAEWNSTSTQVIVTYLMGQDEDLSTGVGLWDIQRGTQQWSFDRPRDLRRTLWFPESGEIVLTSPYGCERCSSDVLLVDAQSGEEVAVLSHPYVVEDVRFSPDGRQIITNAVYRLRVWEAATGQQAYMLPMEVPYSVLYSPNSRYFKATDLSGRESIWVAGTGEPVTRLWGNLCAWYPDSIRIFCENGRSGALILDLRDLR